MKEFPTPKITCLGIIKYFVLSIVPAQLRCKIRFCSNFPYSKNNDFHKLKNPSTQIQFFNSCIFIKPKLKVNAEKREHVFYLSAVT